MSVIGCTRRLFSHGFCYAGFATVGLTPAVSEPVAQIDVSADRVLSYAGIRVPCVVGRAGIAREKSEGDGKTPTGRYPLRQLLYRSDRLPRVETALPARSLDRQDAWCDDPGSAQYNTLVKRPFAKHAETLWRPDHLYDVLIVLGFNDTPAVPGRGSAIFLHVAPPGLAATDGCVAIGLEPLLALARTCSVATMIEIAAA